MPPPSSRCPVVPPDIAVIPRRATPSAYRVPKFLRIHINVVMMIICCDARPVFMHHVEAHVFDASHQSGAGACRSALTGVRSARLAPCTTDADHDSQTLFEQLQAKVSEVLSRSPAQDVEKNLKAMLSAFFSRLDLVTREEFDIQRRGAAAHPREAGAAGSQAGRDRAARARRRAVARRSVQSP